MFLIIIFIGKSTIFLSHQKQIVLKCLFFSSVNAIFVASMAYTSLQMLQVKNNNDPTEEEKREQKRIIFTYCISDFIRASSMFVSDNIIIFSMAGLSRSLHKSIIFKLLRASFTKFYNLITCGRLMNRLSKDIYEIDTLLFIDLSCLLNYFGSVIAMSIMFFFCFSLRVTPIGIAYIIFSIGISVYFLKAKRQLVRIGNIFIVFEIFLKLCFVTSSFRGTV